MNAPNSRRSFIWKLGAGASAAVAAVAAGKPAAAIDDPAVRAAMLEEELKLRRLHQLFGQALDKGRHEEVISMFADDAEVLFNGGVFSGRERGVARLYRDRFAAGKSGGRIEPAPGFELAADQQQDVVRVAQDLRSAAAVFPYSIQVGVPFETESSLAAMARLHGEGVRTWWEGGLYRIAYRNDATGKWQISRLEYDTQTRADWRSGKRHAQPIEVARFTARFPQDLHGPDSLV
jgi:hypothetical protein